MKIILVTLFCVLSLISSKKLRKTHAKNLKTKSHSKIQREQEIQEELSRFIARRKKSSTSSKKSNDVPPTQTLASMIKDPSKPDCDGEPMSTKKDINVFRYRFSNGPAAYIYDTIDEMLKETFKSDAEGDFDYFVGLSKTDPTSKDDPKNVDWDGINEGFKKDLWKVKNKTAPPQTFLKVYAKDASAKNPVLNLREFVFMESQYFSQRASVIFNCAKCLKKTRESIDTLFNFLDCNQLGFINANMIHGGLQNLDVKVKPTTTMVNDFVLKAMEFNTASLNIKDFTYAVLMGLIERHMPNNGTKWDDTQLDIMIKARQEAIDAGKAPLRR